MNTSEIHQQEIDVFFFNEFVSQLPPQLKTLALNTQVLHHTKEARQITSLADIYGKNYMLMPWTLGDIFPVPEMQRSKIVKAYTLFFTSYVIIDHLVDGQVPDPPMVALLCHHLLLGATEQFATVFDNQHPFWKVYYANERDILNSLAQEAFCLDRHQQVYTAELIEKVSAAKAAPFRVLGYVLAACSGRMEYLSVLDLAYNKLMLADQYGDDVDDLRDDYLMKRATLPIVRFTEIENITLAEAFGYPPDYVEDVLTKNGVLLDMCDQAINALQTGLEALSSIGLGESDVAKLLAFRLDEEQYRKRRVTTVGLLRAFSKRLTT